MVESLDLSSAMPAPFLLNRYYVSSGKLDRELN